MNALIVFSAVVAAASASGIVAPVAYNGAIAAPLAYNGAAINYNAVPAHLAAPSSQFHAGDELGNINYGYTNINSAKHEVGNAYGGVTGSYQYVDAYGIPQRVDYIADALGFRVKASNLPVGPAPVAAVEYAALVGPAPVVDTPEVAAAKIEFQAAYDEAASREKRSAPVYGTAYGRTALNVLPYGLYNGLNGYNALNGLNGAYGYNALNYAAGIPAINAYNTVAAPAVAATYAAPAVAATYGAPVAARDAILTKIQLNPGHAVAYRVD